MEKRSVSECLERKRLQFRTKHCEWCDWVSGDMKMAETLKESEVVRRYTDLSTCIPITSTQLPLWMIAFCPLTSPIYRCFLPRFCPNLFSSHAVSQVRYCAALPSRGPTWLVLLSYLKETIRFRIGCIKWWIWECSKILMLLLPSVAFIQFRSYILFVILQYFFYLYVNLLNDVIKEKACSLSYCGVDTFA
jgi:hypothetical protein